MAWLSANWQYVLFFAIWILNEVVASNPDLKSNSIFQLIMGVLGSLGPKDPGTPPPPAA